jgi:hypothetical protein
MSTTSTNAIGAVNVAKNRGATAMRSLVSALSSGRAVPSPTMAMATNSAISSVRIDLGVTPRAESSVAEGAGTLRGRSFRARRATATPAVTHVNTHRLTAPDSAKAWTELIDPLRASTEPATANAAGAVRP